MFEGLSFPIFPWKFYGNGRGHMGLVQERIWEWQLLQGNNGNQKHIKSSRGPIHCVVKLCYCQMYSLKLCSELCYPDRHTVCLMLMLCSMQFVLVVYDWGCRINYQLQDWGICMGGSRDLSKNMMGVGLKITGNRNWNKNCNTRTFVQNHPSRYYAYCDIIMHQNAQLPKLNFTKSEGDALDRNPFIHSFIFV